MMSKVGFLTIIALETQERITRRMDEIEAAHSDEGTDSYGVDQAEYDQLTKLHAQLDEYAC